MQDIDAWLEKQNKHANFRNKIQIGDKVTRNEDGVLVNLSQLKRVAKPVDKAEPKFHEGEWVIGDKDNTIHQVKIAVKNVSNGKYAYDLVDGGYISTSHEGDYHLWTIKDARDGDVLAFKNNISGIIICKSPTNYDTRSYCRLVCDNLINKEESGWDSTLLVPATKEQRDTLEKAMADAGYTFDFEKKELKKIINQI